MEEEQENEKEDGREDGQQRVVEGRVVETIKTTMSWAHEDNACDDVRDTHLEPMSVWH